MRRNTFTVDVLAAICVLGTVLAAGCGKSGGNGQPGGKPPTDADPPAPVTVVGVVRKAMPIELETFGTVEPNATVAVTSQVAGELVGVHFQRGQDVRKGDLLFTIDPRPALAKRKLAEANLSRDKAQYENARKEAERQRGLLEQKLVAQGDYDRILTTAESLDATVRADKAAIESARLEVLFSSIRSPIDGRTGDLLVDAGNTVQPGVQKLVVINQVRPIRVSFSLPQRGLPKIMERVGAAGAEGLEVHATIPGRSGEPEKGRVAIVDNAVDRATGTIRLWALFPNEESRLWPGQLINVSLSLGMEPNALVVPSPAVLAGQKGNYVFVAKPGDTVEIRVVEVDRTVGDDTVVSKGLEAGERVVTDGQLRLRPGSRIAVRPEGGNGAPRP
ncbi:MAG: efflux RND transporter periplasmic adaptor subunit [Deltaproteobacteria bacterium]|nr:efflux RND transporter periplasmic adaptor subunit [Deltaproteobacteria bacterium]